MTRPVVSAIRPKVARTSMMPASPPEARDQRKSRLLDKMQLTQQRFRAAKATATALMRCLLNNSLELYTYCTDRARAGEQPSYCTVAVLLTVAAVPKAPRGERDRRTDLIQDLLGSKYLAPPRGRERPPHVPRRPLAALPSIRRRRPPPGSTYCGPDSTSDRHLNRDSFTVFTLYCSQYSD